MIPYLQLISPLVAIINGVIAVYVSQFKPEDVYIKTILLCVAIGFGVISAIATVAYQHNIIKQIKADKDRKRAIRINIAGFITRANNILETVRDLSTTDEDAIAQANSWYADAQVYLNTISPDYVARMHNTSGLAPIHPNGLRGQDRINLWIGVYHRTARLEQFASEFSG